MGEVIVAAWAWYAIVFGLGVSVGVGVSIAVGAYHLNKELQQKLSEKKMQAWAKRDAAGSGSGAGWAQWP